MGREESFKPGSRIAWRSRWVGMNGWVMGHTGTTDMNEWSIGLTREMALASAKHVLSGEIVWIMIVHCLLCSYSITNTMNSLSRCSHLTISLSILSNPVLYAA